MNFVYCLRYFLVYFSLGFLVHDIAQNAYCSRDIYLQFMKYLRYVIFNT